MYFGKASKNNARGMIFNDDRINCPFFEENAANRLI